MVILIESGVINLMLGWSSNEEASVRRYKKILLEEYDMLQYLKRTGMHSIYSI